MTESESNTVNYSPPMAMQNETKSKTMTRIDIINRELTDLKNKQATAVGSVLRDINKRILAIQNVLLREMNYPNQGGNSMPALDAKVDKANVLDLQWLSEHGMTPEQLKGKILDALVVKGMIDGVIDEKLETSVVMTTSLFLTILGFSSETDLLSFTKSLSGRFDDNSLLSSKIIRLLFKEVMEKIEANPLPLPFHYSVPYAHATDKVNETTGEPVYDYRSENMGNVLADIGWSNVSRNGVLFALTKTTAEINAIQDCYTGTIVFNSSLNVLCFKDNAGGWKKISVAPM